MIQSIIYKQYTVPHRQRMIVDVSSIGNSLIYKLLNKVCNNYQSIRTPNSTKKSTENNNKLLFPESRKNTNKQTNE